MVRLLTLLLLSAALMVVNSSCTLSDILLSNTDCLPPQAADTSFVPLPPFELHLQLISQNEDEVIGVYLKNVLEYYLNYTLAQFDDGFDDDDGFDSGGFAYAVVTDIEQSEQVIQQQTAKIWSFSVTAGVYYQLSPGGWIFSSTPTSMEALDRVKSVVEEQSDDQKGTISTLFGQVVEKFYQDDELQVLSTKVLYSEDSESNASVDTTTSSPSLRPTREPSQKPSNNPTKRPSKQPTHAPTNYPTTLAPTPEPTAEPSESINPTVAPTPNPSTKQPTLVQLATMTPVTMETDVPTQSAFKLPTPLPTSNYELAVTYTSPSPTMIMNDEIELLPTLSPSYQISNIADDATVGARASNVNKNRTQLEESFNQALLQASSLINNQSTIIASSALAGAFLLLVLVSGAFFVSRRTRTKVEMTGDKDIPLHTRSDEEWKDDMLSNGIDVETGASMAITYTEENQVGGLDEDLNENEDYAMKKIDDMVNQRLHSPISPQVPMQLNNKSALSTSTEKSYDADFLIGQYDEEKVAAKEMARELFLTQDDSIDLDVFEGAGFALDDISNVDDDMNVEGASLEYSESDAPNHEHQTKTHPVITSANIVSPVSLPGRRSQTQPNINPSENDVTIISDGDSLPGLEDDDNSSDVLEVIKGNASSWTRFITECTPTSIIRDLVLPNENAWDFDDASIGTQDLDEVPV
eukprot:scaffold1758_cov40-Cyclotella_meneghiniana.AAC.8